MTKTYEQDFRKALGFTNQSDVKEFFKATDCVSINWPKINMLNRRLKELFTRIHHTVHPSIQAEDFHSFLQTIDIAYQKIRKNDFLPRLNNFGRTPENVYYNWMRGYCAAAYFTKAIAVMLNIRQSAIHQIGMDDLDHLETFSQSPMADIEVSLSDSSKIRFEVQSGYTGTNDIKKHKVEEGKRVFKRQGIRSYVIHFNLFNGKAAVVDISEIDDQNLNYKANSRLEGQIVFSIPPEAFRYKLQQTPPAFKDLIY